MKPPAVSKSEACRLLGRIKPAVLDGIVAAGLISPLPYTNTFAAKDIRQLVKRLRTLAKQKHEQSNAGTPTDQDATSERETGPLGSESDHIGEAQEQIRKGLDLDKPMSHSEAINIYRAITGACREGIRQWMNGKDLPDPITIRQVIDMTSEDYGGREFAEFFEVGR